MKAEFRKNDVIIYDTTLILAPKARISVVSVYFAWNQCHFL